MCQGLRTPAGYSSRISEKFTVTVGEARNPRTAYRGRTARDRANKIKFTGICGGFGASVARPLHSTRPGAWQGRGERNPARLQASGGTLGKRRLTSGRLGGGATLWGAGGCASGVLGSIFSIGCISVKSFCGNQRECAFAGFMDGTVAPCRSSTSHGVRTGSPFLRLPGLRYGRRVGDDLAFFAMLCPPDVVVKLGPRTPMAGGTRKASWGGPWAWGQVFVVCLCMGFRVRTRFFASGLNGSVMLSDLATRLFWPRS